MFVKYIIFKMKRTFRRARKAYRPRKAKRYFKSRINRSYKRYNRPDAGYSEKVTFTRDFVVDANGTDAWFNANWTGTGGSSAHEVFFNDQTQFLQMAPIWKEYKITGMSVKFTPLTLYAGGSGQKTISAIESGTLMDRYGSGIVSSGDLQQTLDYRLYRGGSGLSRYYKVYKYAKSKDLGWRDTAVAVANSYASVPNCVTAMGSTTTGFKQGDSIGRIDVVWYIKFKTRTK